MIHYFVGVGGVRRLCAGLCHDAVHTSLVCCIRRDGRRDALGRTPVIRRSILYVLLCFPIRLAGPACSPGPLCFCLTGDGVRAGLRADKPLYLGHEVAGQPHHALVV